VVAEAFIIKFLNNIKEIFDNQGLFFFFNCNLLSNYRGNIFGIFLSKRYNQGKNEYQQGIRTIMLEVFRK
jgi:hypothetical protein